MEDNKRSEKNEKNEWKELFLKYKSYILVGAVVVVLLITLLNNYGGAEKALTEENQNGEQTQIEDRQAEEEENNLEENAHASINRLIEKYLDCLASGDLESLEDILDVVTEEDRKNIEARSTITGSFENVKCYTKKGPVEDSYIVFVTYEMRLSSTVGEIKTPAPGIECVYVSPKKDGKRYIHGEADEDEELKAYVLELEKDPEVQALYEDVQKRYDEAKESDKNLADFAENLASLGQSSSIEETIENTEEAGTEEENSSEEVTEAENEEASSESSQEGSTFVGVRNRQTRVLDTVNVRAEWTTESERIAVAYKGDNILQVKSYENGWSKVEFKGLTGYVRTEFLE